MALQSIITEKINDYGVIVISREMIKPSSPTPNDKKTVLFSLIDQISPGGYTPRIFFYQKNESMDSIAVSRFLKKGLSETLVVFYPLAGRIKQKELIDCNDEGVEFCESQISEDLIQYIEDPSLQKLQAMLPFQGEPRHGNIVMSVQVNHFPCGGMAIGMCLSHKIADGSATIDFLEAWSRKTKDPNYIITRPSFNGAALFPPLKELNEPILPPISRSTEIRYVGRRVIFEKKTIDELKLKAESNNTLVWATRVEVVIAFLWQHLPRKISRILQIVNLRNRMVKPVPKEFFGNCAWMTKLSPANSRLEVFIHEFRKAISKISENYMPDFLSSDNFLEQLKKENDSLFNYPLGESIFCNSISGFPFYKVDFGMGNPIWVCPGLKPFMNAITALNTPCGEGIEAWIYLLEDDIAEFDTSLSQLASPPVSKPLRIK